MQAHGQAAEGRKTVLNVSSWRSLKTHLSSLILFSSSQRPVRACLWWASWPWWPTIPSILMSSCWRTQNTVRETHTQSGYDLESTQLSEDEGLMWVVTSPVHILSFTPLSWTFLPWLFLFFWAGWSRAGLQPAFQCVWKADGNEADLACHAVCLCCLGNTYKFQAGNRMNALLWFKHLSAACQSNRQQVWKHVNTHGSLFLALHSPRLFTQVPANLMSFEWATLRRMTQQRSEGWGTGRKRRSFDSVVGASLPQAPTADSPILSPASMQPPPPPLP